MQLSEKLAWIRRCQNKLGSTLVYLNIFTFILGVKSLIQQISIISFPQNKYHTIADILEERLAEEEFEKLEHVIVIFPTKKYEKGEEKKGMNENWYLFPDTSIEFRQIKGKIE